VIKVKVIQSVRVAGRNEFFVAQVNFEKHLPKLVATSIRATNTTGHDIARGLAAQSLTKYWHTGVGRGIPAAH